MTPMVRNKLDVRTVSPPRLNPNANLKRQNNVAQRLQYGLVGVPPRAVWLEGIKTLPESLTGLSSLSTPFHLGLQESLCPGPNKPFETIIKAQGKRLMDELHKDCSHDSRVEVTKIVYTQRNRRDKG